MDRLYHHTGNAMFKEMVKITMGEHNDTWTKDKKTYYGKINSFIDKAIKKNAKLAKL